MPRAIQTILAACVSAFAVGAAMPATSGVPEAAAIALIPAMGPLSAHVPLSARVQAVLAAPHAADASTTCIATAVHHEAANQSLEGQLAVAQLIIRRTKAEGFAGSVCGVVYQPGQFHGIRAHKVRAGDKRWQTALAIARVAQDGTGADEAPGALYYHAVYVRPSWMMRREVVARIGDHIFYR